MGIVKQKTWTVYLLVSPSGRKYVGISDNYKRRMSGYAGRHAANGQPALRRAIRKYGWKNFSARELAVGIQSAQSAKACEIAFISILGSFENGYNCTMGGDGSLGLKHSPATIEKLREISRNRVYRPHTEESKRRMSEGRSGIPVSMERRARISATLTGRKLTPEHRAKCGSGLRGKGHTEQTCNKISKTRLKFRDENIDDVARMRASGMTRQEVADEFGVSPSTIRRYEKHARLPDKMHSRREYRAANAAEASRMLDAEIQRNGGSKVKASNVVGEHFGVSGSAIRGWADWHKSGRPEGKPCGPKTAKSEMADRIDAAVKMFYEVLPKHRGAKCNASEEVGRLFGRTGGTIRRWVDIRETGRL